MFRNLILSAVTAIVITTGGLSAETKDMRAVPKTNVDEVIYTEPNPKIYDTLPHIVRVK